MKIALISGDDLSLRIIQKNFSKWVKVKNGEYYLDCPNFKTMTPEKIRNYGNKKLKYMMQYLSLIFDKKINANIDTVIENSNGTKNIFLSETIHATATVSVRKFNINKDSGELQEIDQELISEDLNPNIERIAKNKNIQEVLEYYYNTTDSNLSFNYYKIIEIIGIDLGSKKNIPKTLNSISRNEFRKLTHALNLGMGDNSRHHTEDDPANHISISEIKSLIKNIVDEWILIKCTN